MIEVHKGVWVTSLDQCTAGGTEAAVVHACKSPCHQNAVGYNGSLPKDHKHYLSLVQGSNLFLNIIDPPVPLFQVETFTTFLAFAIDQYQRQGKELIIHCNQGQSRAPSLALLFLAKGLGVISSVSYIQAREDFELRFGHFQPGEGITTFLSRHWDDIEITARATG